MSTIKIILSQLDRGLSFIGYPQFHSPRTFDFSVPLVTNSITSQFHGNV
jgi:hypothetical protein